tara:strand:- start:717 stop:1400 length:684 start_codon:yes stop_codon:yes gene_type:complete
MAVNKILNFLDKLNPIIKELNERHNLLEDRVSFEVVKFTESQVLILTRKPMDERVDYFDIEINKLNFKIRKAEQNYSHDEVKLLKAFRDELQFFSENHSCIEYKMKNKKEVYFVFSNAQKFDETLEYIHKGLVAKGFIDCSKGKFKALFKESTLKSKVDWKTALSSLNYFVNQLLKIDGFSVSNKWVTSSKCFLHEKEGFDSDNLAKANRVSAGNQKSINSILLSLL